MAFGNGRFIGYGTKGDGSIMFVASTKAPEHVFTGIRNDVNIKQQISNWLKDNFSDWSVAWEEFFANENVSFTPRPQYYFPLGQSWTTQPNLTMIGDAAHRMPPFAGEGANVAMQDAFELAACLTDGNFESLIVAFSHFEKQMIRRGAEATQDTLENSARMHSATALQQMLDFFSQTGTGE